MAAGSTESVFRLAIAAECQAIGKIGAKDFFMKEEVTSGVKWSSTLSQDCELSNAR